jgi:hypothetical protein
MTVCTNGRHRLVEGGTATVKVRARGKTYEVQSCRACRRESNSRNSRRAKNSPVDNCRDCGREIVVGRSGCFARHKAPAGHWCPGSGEEP